MRLNPSFSGKVRGGWSDHFDEPPAEYGNSAETVVAAFLSLLVGYIYNNSDNNITIYRLYIFIFYIYIYISYIKII